MADVILEMKDCDIYIQSKRNAWMVIKEQDDTNRLREFFNDIINYALSLTDERSIETCLAFFESCIKEKNYESNIVDGWFGLTSLGLDAYEKKQFSIAEFAFRILSDCGDPNGRNNYAYMIRRGESSNQNDASLMKALRLLREGVNEHEPFAFVNMALLLSLHFKTDLDWHLADDLIKELPPNKTDAIQIWWYNVAQSGDVEGVLVHYLLMRHKKIKSSELGSMERMSKQIKAQIDSFPDWLQTSPRFQTLSDVFEIFLEDDFENALVEYINEMPKSRDSVREIMAEIDQWDEWMLYKMLLQDFRELMTQAEFDVIIEKYKKKFSIPLSSIIDLKGNQDNVVIPEQED